MSDTVENSFIENSSIDFSNILFSYKYTIAISIIICVALILYLFLFRKKNLENYSNKKLKTLEEFDPNITEDKILVIANNGCIWCEKMKQDLIAKVKDNKIYNNEIIFLTVSNDGAKLFESLNKEKVGDLDKYLLNKYFESEKHNLKGFPTTVTKTNIVTGYIEDKDIFNKIFSFN